LLVRRCRTVEIERPRALVAARVVEADEAVHVGVRVEYYTEELDAEVGRECEVCGVDSSNDGGRNRARENDLIPCVDHGRRPGELAIEPREVDRLAENEQNVIP